MERLLLEKLFNSTPCFYPVTLTPFIHYIQSPPFFIPFVFSFLRFSVFFFNCFVLSLFLFNFAFISLVPFLQFFLSFSLSSFLCFFRYVLPSFITSFVLFPFSFPFFLVCVFFSISFPFMCCLLLFSSRCFSKASAFDLVWGCQFSTLFLNGLKF